MGKQVNGTFRMLSAIAIVLVVAGHADFHIFDMGGLFPYYSFHVAIFLFISGYFYKEDAKENIWGYIRHKAVRLMIPYFLWNLFYGLLAFVLRFLGFSIGGELNLRTLFLQPFIDGHQYGYHFPSWFVPALFFVEVIYVCMRKILSLLHLESEWFITGACLLAGIFTVWLAIGGHVWGYYKLPGRILFMLPMYQFGRLYQTKLEKRDTMSNALYFSILLILQLVIVGNCGGLAYSMVWCASFANGPVIPFLTTITGIAFWLRLARILSPLLPKLRLVDRIGKNTFAIMMHHILAFVLLKGVFCLLADGGRWFADFDKTAYLTDIGYVYVPGGIPVFQWLYLAAGILLPLFIQWGIDKIMVRIVDIRKDKVVSAA